MAKLKRAQERHKQEKAYLLARHVAEKIAHSMLVDTPWEAPHVEMAMELFGWSVVVCPSSS